MPLDEVTFSRKIQKIVLCNIAFNSAFTELPTNYGFFLSSVCVKTTVDLQNALLASGAPWIVH